MFFMTSGALWRHRTSFLVCDWVAESDSFRRRPELISFNRYRMKVLLNYHIPFWLAHGGLQVQVEQTKAAIEEAGVDVEPVRWWDDNQTGDIFHHFTRIPEKLVHLAHRKGMKVVMSDLLTEQGSRSKVRLRIQKLFTGGARLMLPQTITTYFGWESYRLVDACIALTPWEAHLIKYRFGAPAEKVHVVANGVEKAFLESRPMPRGKWLVCTATITERKEVLKLAEAAVIAQAPIWIIGKPYSESDTYFQRFLALAKANSLIIRYEGGISDRNQLAEIYRQARGFVLLSKWESLSLSALEAAACECPLLLSDLPWAKSHFGESAAYCRANDSISQIASHIKNFYDSAPNQQPPPKPDSWPRIGVCLREIYDQVLKQKG